MLISLRNLRVTRGQLFSTIARSRLAQCEPVSSSIEFKNKNLATNEQEFSRMEAVEETNDESIIKNRFVIISVHSWLKFLFLRVIEIHEHNYKSGCDAV